MARFVTSSSSSEAAHVTRRSPEPTSVEQAKAEADRKTEEILRRYEAKIQNGDYTDADTDVSKQLSFRGISGSQTERICLQLFKLSDIMQDCTGIKKIRVQERINGNDGFGHLQDRPAVMQKPSSGSMMQLNSGRKIKKLFFVGP